MTFHLSNPVIDVVEMDKNSVWSGVPDGGNSFVYIVPVGTVVSWEEGIYDDVERNLRYSALHVSGDSYGTGGPLFGEETGTSCKVPSILIFLGVGLSEIVPSSPKENWVSVSFCGVWPDGDEHLDFTDNTVVDLAQYGPVVLNNVAAKKAVTMDGKALPLYEIRPNSGFFKCFAGEHGVFTVYKATMENGQLKKGDVSYTSDTHTNKYGVNTISHFCFTDNNVGLYSFAEITGEPTFWGNQPTIRFAVHVVDDQPTAYASTQTVSVDGKPVTFECCALKDEKGNAINYIKLRDLGKALGFNVDWSSDRGIFLETDKPYDPAN